MDMNQYVFMASSYFVWSVCLFIIHSLWDADFFFYRARIMNGGSMCATIRVVRTKMFEMIMFYATEIKHPRFWTLKALVFGSHKTVYCNQQTKRTVGVPNKCIFLNVQGL